MPFEVENKFRVRDHKRLIRQFQTMGVDFGAPIEQVDTYFAHPVRDFAKTDEAFRLRRIGPINRVTYKGPKIDQLTKTRLELELPLAEGDEMAAGYIELWIALGFQPVATVTKLRRVGTCQWKTCSVEIALDDVTRLGLFIELEICASRETLAEAQNQLVQLAAHLHLPQPERRSYLEMLLEGGDSA